MTLVCANLGLCEAVIMREHWKSSSGLEKQVLKSHIVGDRRVTLGVCQSGAV